jgi:hypothetical protein
MELYSYLVNSISQSKDEEVLKWINPFKRLEFSLSIYHNLVYKKSLKIEEEKSILKREVQYEKKMKGKQNHIIEQLKKEE